MPRTVEILTAEYVPVVYDAAGFVSRLAAFIIDFIIEVLLCMVIVAAIRLIVGASVGYFAFLANFGAALTFILIYAVLLGYGIFFEMLWSGVTPGKRLFHLRAMRRSGGRIDFLSSTIRNLLRFVDFGILNLPGGSVLILSGTPALAAMWFSSANQRIGDFAAGTVVVADRSVGSGSWMRPERPEAAVAAMTPYVHHLERLTPIEYRQIRQFVRKAADLTLPARAASAARIAVPIVRKLEITPPLTCQLDYFSVLAAIEWQWAKLHGLI
ncbi:MAG: RDD family protein [Armatimonadetes bacterium]|nr:RDD family protein [Armatimonadota bacterium]MDE2205395.1 RDD family protein [Armatimonadota bacterium]